MHGQVELQVVPAGGASPVGALEHGLPVVGRLRSLAGGLPHLQRGRHLQYVYIINNTRGSDLNASKLTPNSYVYILTQKIELPNRFKILPSMFDFEI